MTAGLTLGGELTGVHVDQMRDTEEVSSFWIDLPLAI